MKTILWDKNSPEIITKSIDSIQKKYLKKIGESSINGISLEKGKSLFVLVIRDFKKGTLSPDELSSFGFEIFHGVAKNYPKSDLFQATLDASDLRFYMRVKGSYENLIRRLNEIDNFYEINNDNIY